MAASSSVAASNRDNDFIAKAKKQKIRTHGNQCGWMQSPCTSTKHMRWALLQCLLVTLMVSAVPMATAKTDLIHAQHFYQTHQHYLHEPNDKSTIRQMSENKKKGEHGTMGYKHYVLYTLPSIVVHLDFYSVPPLEENDMSLMKYHLEHVTHDHLMYFFEDALNMKYDLFAFDLGASLQIVHKHHHANNETRHDESASLAAVSIKAKFDGKVAFYDLPKKHYYDHYYDMNTTTTTTTTKTNTTSSLIASSRVQLGGENNDTNNNGTEEQKSEMTMNSTMDQETVDMLIKDAFATSDENITNGNTQQGPIFNFFNRLRDSNDYFLSQVSQISVEIVVDKGKGAIDDKETNNGNNNTGSIKEIGNGDTGDQDSPSSSSTTYNIIFIAGASLFVLVVLLVIHRTRKDRSKQKKVLEQKEHEKIVQVVVAYPEDLEDSILDSNLSEDEYSNHGWRETPKKEGQNNANSMEVTTELMRMSPQSALTMSPILNARASPGRKQRRIQEEDEEKEEMKLEENEEITSFEYKASPASSSKKEGSSSSSPSCKQDGTTMIAIMAGHDGVDDEEGKGGKMSSSSSTQSASHSPKHLSFQSIPIAAKSSSNSISSSSSSDEDSSSENNITPPASVVRSTQTSHENNLRSNYYRQRAREAQRCADPVLNEFRNVHCLTRNRPSFGRQRLLQQRQQDQHYQMHRQHFSAPPVASVTRYHTNTQGESQSRGGGSKRSKYRPASEVSSMSSRSFG